MTQAAVRAWPAGAVHDTVAAIMRTAPFRRSLQTTLLERLVDWLKQGFERLAHFLGGFASGRAIVIWITAILVAALLLRALLAARARDPDVAGAEPRSRARAGEDPWRAAERLEAAGDHEGAAHALYRGVLASLARRERLRLDASKTSGDYSRELRARGSAAHQPFRAFARRFDAAAYGHAPLDAELVADLLRLALPLRDGARAA